MRSSAKGVSLIGKLLISNGIEKMTQFEQYWGQYDEAEQAGG
jgi:hypothetical protein